MLEHADTASPTPNGPDSQGNWRREVEADLAAQVRAGGTLYGYRRDGAYVARTRNGDQVIRLPVRESA